MEAALLYLVGPTPASACEWSLTTVQLLSIPEPLNVGAARRARPVHPDELQMDRQTFRDLEIFEAEGGAPSIFDLLNYTRTSGGSKVLQARLRTPWSKAERIRAVHEALRFIEEHGPAFDWFPGEVLISPVEQYLNSGLPMVSSNNALELFLESAEVRFGETIDYRRIIGRIMQTARLIHALRRFAERPELAHPPGDLGPLLTELRSLLELPAFNTLPDEGSTEPWFWQTMRIDRILRSDERAALDRILRLTFEIDALAALSEANRKLGFILPEVFEGSLEITAEHVRHPFLPDAVGNPLHLDNNRRLLFLTGPNMAGKTTYLRSCGISIYLAHLGVGVPAKSFRFSPCDSLFTAIALVDNIREGISFFRAEALRIKAIARALADGRRVIALLDEPFMGTNVKDAYDASRAVLTRLVKRENSVYVVSSHLLELGEGLVETRYVECSRFEATEDSGRLAYDYRLRPGISSQRLGLRVLREEGVFELLDQVNPSSVAAADYSTPINSTSNTSVVLGGTSPGTPADA